MERRSRPGLLYRSLLTSEAGHVFSPASFGGVFSGDVFALMMVLLVDVQDSEKDKRSPSVSFLGR